MVLFVQETSTKESPMSDSKDKLQSFRRVEDWERLAVLEVRVNDHEEDLKQVFKHQELLSEGIAGINSTLKMILYVLIGAGSAILVQEIGLMKVLVAFFT